MVGRPSGSHKMGHCQRLGRNRETETEAGSSPPTFGTFRRMFSARWYTEPPAKTTREQKRVSHVCVCDVRASLKAPERHSFFREPAEPLGTAPPHFSAFRCFAFHPAHSFRCHIRGTLRFACDFASRTAAHSRVTYGRRLDCALAQADPGSLKPTHVPHVLARGGRGGSPVAH
jgi:hypothetical protein